MCQEGDSDELYRCLNKQCLLSRGETVTLIQ